MTLAVGSTVYLSVGGGLQSDPPLFGTVVSITGTAPDVLKVNWENGVSQTYASTAPVNMVEVGTDADENDLLGNRMSAIEANPASQRTGVVCRTFYADPDTLNTRTALLRTDSGLWFLEAVANLNGTG